MITIIYKDYFLEVKGHSGFDLHGKDIVCAGVSAIVCGSFEILKKNSNFSIIQDSHNALISFKIINKTKLDDVEKLKFIYLLLFEIYTRFPKFIKIT